MILKKPFAIFIKHFRFIHLIITISALYLLFRTINILTFYMEYMDIMAVSTANTSSLDLFGVVLVVFITIVIAGNILILLLLKNKKKPITFYIINIIIYSFLALTYGFSYYVTRQIEVGLVDVRLLRILQDFLVIAIVLESLSLVMFIIRTLGFDIKKFDFESDIQELEITNEDNEEIEINIDFDFDKFKRTTRKQFRHLKYVYMENKVIINIILVIILMVIGYLTYSKIFIYNKIYKQNKIFNVAKYQMNVTDSYIVTTDSNGDTIKKNVAFVVVNIKLRTTLRDEIKFENARLSLKIGNHLFYSTRDYKDYLKDLGNTYLNENLKNTMTNYLFVFEIPEKYKNRRMSIKYFDYNSKTANIRIKPVEFKENSEYSYSLGDIVDFKYSILGNTTLEITDVEIKDMFKNKYKFCTKGKCYDSYEYIFPSYTGTIPKAILKINGKLSWELSKQIKGVDDLSDFIETYGHIVYDSNGNTKKMDMDVKKVEPIKYHEENTYYIEIPKEAKTANNIYIDFKIRDKNYRYAVK